METYLTYCSACDSEVLVRLDPLSREELDPSNVVCLDRDEACTDRRCPLMGAPASEIRDSLEFLPPGKAGGTPRSLREAAELLERARRASLGRQARRAAE